MTSKKEIQKVIDVFNLDLDGDLLYKHYTNDTNNFKTNLDAKKAKLLEGPTVQVMSSVASRGGQKGGDLLINALLIVIFGMTMLIYNKQKKNEQKDATYYERGRDGRYDIYSYLLKNTEKGNKQKIESEIIPKAEEGRTGIYNLTSQQVLDNRHRRNSESQIDGTGPEGQRLVAKQTEILERNKVESKKKQKAAEKERRRKEGRKLRAKSANRRRELNKNKTNGGRKKKKRTRKKKRRN